MSYRWPNKDPDEILDYSIDWSRFLGEGVSIATVQWFVDDDNGNKNLLEEGQVVNGIQNVSTTKTDTVATINLGLGNNSKEYKFHCRITDTTGSTAERTIKLRIRNR